MVCNCERDSFVFFLLFISQNFMSRCVFLPSPLVPEQSASYIPSLPGTLPDGAILSQFLLATSAIYEVCGLYVVSKGIQRVVCISLARKLSSCVSDKTLRISESTLSLLYPNGRKNWNIAVFIALVRLLVNISSLVLRLGCMVYFSLNAVGVPKSNAGMGEYPFVSEKCLC